MTGSQTPAVPPYPYSGGPHLPPQRSTGLVKWLVIGAIVFGLAILSLFATCIYIGMAGPATKVLPGRQVPARFLEQIRKLNLLEPDEQIQYFYSDSLLNIEGGFYLLTDRKVVVYSRTFDEPAILVPFSNIVEVEAEFSDDWLDDSWITITLNDGTFVSFPASAEAGGDRKMYQALKKRVEPAGTP